MSQCLEISVQDGRFILQDIEFDPIYLSNKIQQHSSAGTGEAKIPTIKIEKARLKKLSIHLSIVQNDGDNKNKTIGNHGSTNKEFSQQENTNSDINENSTTATTVSSTMRNIFRFSSNYKNMSLIAQIELDGLDVHCSPVAADSTFYQESKNMKSVTHNDQAHDSSSGNGGGYLSSIVDAALASLKLSVCLRDIHFVFYDSSEDITKSNMNLSSSLSSYEEDEDFGDCRTWLGLNIQSVLYDDFTIHTSGPTNTTTDMNDSHSHYTTVKKTDFGSADNNDENLEALLHKSIVISDISIVDSFTPSSSPILQCHGKISIFVRAYKQQQKTNQTDALALLHHDVQVLVSDEDETSDNISVVGNIDQDKMHLISNIISSFHEQTQQNTHDQNNVVPISSQSTLQQEQTEVKVQSSSHMPTSVVTSENKSNESKSDFILMNSNIDQDFYSSKNKKKGYPKTENEGGRLVHTNHKHPSREKDYENNNGFNEDIEEDLEEIFFDCNDTSFSQYMELYHQTQKSFVSVNSESTCECSSEENFKSVNTTQLQIHINGVSFHICDEIHILLKELDISLTSTSSPPNHLHLHDNTNYSTNLSLNLLHFAITSTSTMRNTHFPVFEFIRDEHFMEHQEGFTPSPCLYLELSKSCTTNIDTSSKTTTTPTPILQMELSTLPMEITLRSQPIKTLQALLQDQNRNEEKNIHTMEEDQTMIAKEQNKSSDSLPTTQTPIVKLSYICPFITIFVSDDGGDTNRSNHRSEHSSEEKTERTLLLNDLFKRKGSSTSFEIPNNNIPPSKNEELMLGLCIQNISVQYGSTENRLSLETTCKSISIFVLLQSSGEKEERILHEIINMYGEPVISSNSLLKLNYTSNNIENNDSNNKMPESSLFPQVPSLSTVKARQESSHQDRAVRGEDPQKFLMKCAKNCQQSMSIQIPTIVLDVSIKEAKALQFIVGEMQRAFSVDDDNKEIGDTTASSLKTNTSSSQSPLFSIELSFVCDQGIFSIRNDYENDISENVPMKSDKYDSFLLVLVGWKTHCVKDSVQNIQNLRCLSNDVIFYEAVSTPLSPQKVEVQIPSSSNQYNNSYSLSSMILTGNRAKKPETQVFATLEQARPIFHRSNLASPFSPETPLFLIDVINRSVDEEEGEQETTVHLSVYDFTHRFSGDLNWTKRLLTLVQALKSEDEYVNDQNIDKHRQQQNQEETNQDGIPSTMTKLFVTFSDCAIDYTSLKEFKRSSRTIFRIGEVRLSSIFMNDTQDNESQAIKVSIADLSLHICNWRYPYNYENKRLRFSQRIMNADETRKSAGQAQYHSKKNNRQNSDVEEVLNRMNFISIANIDSVDVLLQLNMNPSTSSPSPKLIGHFTFGLLSMYVCKDSFSCFMDTINELVVKLTALTEDELVLLKEQAEPKLITKNTTDKKTSEKNDLKQLDDIIESDRPLNNAGKMSQKKNVNNTHDNQEDKDELQTDKVPLNILDMISEDMFNSHVSDVDESSLFVEGKKTSTNDHIILQHSTKKRNDNCNRTNTMPTLLLPDIPDSKLFSPSDSLAETFLIKNFYTLDISNHNNRTDGQRERGNEDEIRKFTSGPSILRKFQNEEDMDLDSIEEVASSFDFLEYIPEKGDEDFTLGGQDWTTVDHVWARKFTREEGKEIDQKAKWYHDNENRGKLSSSNSIFSSSSDNIKIFPQHISSSRIREDPIFEESLLLDATKYTGTSVEPTVNARFLVKDMYINLRFFDGHDWITDPPQEVIQKESTTREKTKVPISNNDSSLFGDDDTDGDVDSLLFGPSNSNIEKKDALMEELIQPTINGSKYQHSCDGFIGLDDTSLPQISKKISNKKRKRRQQSKFFQFSFHGLKVRFDSYTPSEEYLLTSCMRLKANDFFLSESISSSESNSKRGRSIKMIGEWVDTHEHPRETHDGIISLKMVSMRPSCIFSADGKLMSNESLVKLDLLPLRCYVDQNALKFIQNFFSSDSGNDTDAEDEKQDNYIIGTFFKSFFVTSTKLKVNYKPHHMDINALREGTITELLNIFPLEALALNLQPVHIQNNVDWGPCFSEMLSRWIEDIVSTQIHKFITRGAPFHKITNLQEGMADMVMIPFNNRRDKGRAMREGTTKFATTIAIEALDTTSELTKQIAKGLNKVTPMTKSSKKGSAVKLPPRPGAPVNFQDAFSHSYESVSSGLRAASYTVIMVPKREFKKNGPTGAMKSVIKAVPVAILAPLTGVSEAISYSLLGVRNQLKPELRKEEEESRRGL